MLAVLWTAFIIYGLTTEPSGIPRFPWLDEPGVDKLIHAILFGVEAALCLFATARSETRKAGLFILLWCFILGGGLEVIQYYWVNGRSGDAIDLLADMLGALLGLTVVKRIEKK